jgi:hypothetical protein
MDLTALGRNLAGSKSKEARSGGKSEVHATEIEKDGNTRRARQVTSTTGHIVCVINPNGG